MKGTGKLGLSPAAIERCHRSALAIAQEVAAFSALRSTVSIERAILRMLGVEGADAAGVPIVNRLVDKLSEAGFVTDGVAIHLGQLLRQSDCELARIIDGLVSGELRFGAIEAAGLSASRVAILNAAATAWKPIARSLSARDDLQQTIGMAQHPLAYVLTATGDVREDVRHAVAVATHGGDIIAVLRSTAQSLLDYVPEGPTHEGFGGTYATQANFRIMRDALDSWSRQHGRYIQLSSFCSGLCMPEIAALGLIERLDNMVNDALYGILYRDINMVRTLVDQSFSRRLNAAGRITINTGEDNYLRTADAIQAAPAVIVSQMINYHLARLSGLPDARIGIGNAFEVAPNVEDGLLLEWAQALLTRELFPDCPVKYMPPTRHMDGNPFRTHACDTMFNFITIATRQGIQTIGVPTEGSFTPHIHDRVLALDSVNYLKISARHVFEEIEFKEGGIVRSRAATVLESAATLLERISSELGGLFGAIEHGLFGDVRRSRSGGRGLTGVFVKSECYVNPFDSHLYT